MSGLRSQETNSSPSRMSRAAKLAVAEEIARMRGDSEEQGRISALRMAAKMSSDALMDEFEGLQAEWLSPLPNGFLIDSRAKPLYLMDAADFVAHAQREAEFVAARRAAL